MTPTYDLARLLPHRPPFLLIDRVLHADPQRGALTAERVLTSGDALRLSPGSPLLIEALCQAAACLNGLTAAEGKTGAPHRGVLAGLADFQFHKGGHGAPLAPGDRLRMEVQRERALGALQSFSGRLWRGEALLCGGRLLFAVSFP